MDLKSLALLTFTCNIISKLHNVCTIKIVTDFQILIEHMYLIVIF